MSTTPASVKQVAFVKSLLADKDLTGTLYDCIGWKEGITAPDGTVHSPADHMTSREASQNIDALKALLRKAAPAPTALWSKIKTAPVAPVASVTDGMYRLPDGTIYKVQVAVHGSGNLYAKRLQLTHECWGHEDLDGPIGNVTYCDGRCNPSAISVSFEYTPGAMRLLKPEYKMTLEQAKEFGALYGTCCVCGRTLTKEESIEAGIGPVCGGKF